MGVPARRDARGRYDQEVGQWGGAGDEGAAEGRRAVGFNGAMAADMREWAIEGYGGRVAIRIGPPARTYGGDGPMSDRMTAEFSAELSGPGYFRGTSTVRLAAFDLVRFHRELGGVVAGRQPHATLGSLGDEVGLTVEGEADPEGKAGGARLSGFIGAGLSSAVSFNDIEVDHPSLLRSYVALDALAGDLVGYAVLLPPPGPSAAPPDGSAPPPDGPVAPPDGPAPPPPAARPPPARWPERARRRSSH